MGNVTSAFCCNSCWHLFYKHLLTMFGRRRVQQKSQLTLFDICNLLDLNRALVKHVQDSLYGPGFLPLCAAHKHASVIGWKLNPVAILCWRSDFDRCCIKGLCLCALHFFPDLISIRVNVCIVLYMPTKIHLNVLTCLLIPHKCLCDF